MPLRVHTVILTACLLACSPSAHVAATPEAASAEADRAVTVPAADPGTGGEGEPPAAENGDASTATLGGNVASAPAPAAGDTTPAQSPPSPASAPGSPPATPTWSFDTATLSTAPDDVGQYPGCLTCGQQYYYGVAGCPAAGVGTRRPCQSFCHVKYNTPITYYLDDPPASGNHYPSPEHRLGEHAYPVARGYYVHSMEHGAVILAYNCPDGCDPELAVLRQVVAQRSRPGDEVIMTPDPLMKSARFAALAWTWIYTFDAPDVATLLCFVDQHQNHGRENKPL